MGPSDGSFCDRHFRNASQQKLMLYGIILLAAVVGVILVLAATSPEMANNDDEGTVVVKPTRRPGSDVLKITPLVDGANYIPMLLESLTVPMRDVPFAENLTSDKTYGANWKTDLPKLVAGNVGLQAWTVSVGCEAQHKDVVARVISQVDAVKNLVRSNYPFLRIVYSQAEIMDAFEDKSVGSLIGVSGGYSINYKLSVLRTLYDTGVRYMSIGSKEDDCQVLWDYSAKVNPEKASNDSAKANPENASNDSAKGNSEKASADLAEENTEKTNAESNNATGSEKDGKRSFKKALVLEMNRLGMMIDLSHSKVEEQEEILDISRAPVIYSSTTVANLTGQPKAVPDNILQKLKQNRGLVMVTFDEAQYKKQDQKTTANISNVIDNIEYVTKSIGVEHVGIGSGFHGYKKSIDGLENSAKFPLLFDKLSEKDPDMWTEGNLRLVAGENFKRVFREVEELRNQMIGVKPDETKGPEPPNTACYTKPNN